MTASIAANETPVTTEDGSLPLVSLHPSRLVGVNGALRPTWRRLADAVLIAAAVGAVFWLVKTSWDALTWFIIGLVPKITGDAVNIHPAVLMPLFIMLGVAFGLLGAIFAGPMAALGRDYFLYIHRRLSGATPRAVYHSLTKK